MLLLFWRSVVLVLTGADYPITGTRPRAITGTAWAKVTGSRWEPVTGDRP